MGALSSITVLELGDGVDVEFAGKLLADLGAQVLKVESPSGAASRHQPPFFQDDSDTDCSIHFWHYNTSKRSVICDLSTDEGIHRLRELHASADAVIDAMVTPLAALLGPMNDGGAPLKSRTVYCRITPFGATGPWAGYQSSDLVQLALGGIMASCGYDDPDSAPVAPSGGQSGHMTGVNVAIGVLAGLLSRSRSGVSPAFDIAAHDCVTLATEMAFTYWEYQRTTPWRQTGRHARPYPTSPWNHLCRDGRYVSTLPLYLTDNRFAAMVEWFDEFGLAGPLRDPRYTTRESRTEHLDEIIPVIRDFCAQHDSDYIFHEAQRRRLPWAPVNFTWDLVDDPHFVDREAFVPVAHPRHARTITYPGAPYKLSRTPWAVRGCAPARSSDEV